MRWDIEHMYDMLCRTNLSRPIHTFLFDIYTRTITCIHINITFLYHCYLRRNDTHTKLDLNFFLERIEILGIIFI